MGYYYPYGNVDFFQLHATSFEASVKESTLDITQFHAGI
jgi:hypothetical protein